MQESGEHQQRLWRDMLARDALVAPSPALEAAYFATPRHRFIDRFRTWHNPVWRTGPLDDIYDDNSLILAGDSNDDVLSTCSMPSFILGLVDWLGIEPGHRVLEIGSGCGWLVAIMAHLAGERGHVTGVELIADLAKASRQALAGYDVTIHAGDGSAGFPANAPYDRVIFTAAIAEIPPAFVGQMRLGGRLLAPIRMEEGGTAASVELFERREDGFVSIGSRPGFFVPLRAA